MGRGDQPVLLDIGADAIARIWLEGLLSVLFVGGAIIPQTTSSPVGYLRGVQQHRATDILCVPTMAVALIRHPELGSYDLSSLNAMLCGSAPAPVWIWQKFRDDLGISEIVTGYGMTECGGAMTLTRPQDVIALCKAKLARFKVPEEVVFLEQGELPTTPTGKVQKYRLAGLATERLNGLELKRLERSGG